jgi:hypothetical protein
VIDVQDVDLFAVLIDRVPDAIFTAPGTPVALETSKGARRGAPTLCGSSASGPRMNS